MWLPEAVPLRLTVLGEDAERRLVIQNSLARATSPLGSRSPRSPNRETGSAPKAGAVRGVPIEAHFGASDVCGAAHV
jgi:hypothetical protein